MLKYFDYSVTFAEFPDEVSLCVNLSNCPNKCEKCSESWLAQDIGTVLNKDITNTDWNEISGESYFYINQLITSESLISFGISWTTSNSTLAYAGSIADCEFFPFYKSCIGRIV